MYRLALIASAIMLVSAPAAFASSHSAASKHGIALHGIQLWAPKKVYARLDGANCFNTNTGAALVCAYVPSRVSNNYPLRSGRTVSCQGTVDQLDALLVFDVTLGPQQSYNVPSFPVGYDPNTGSPSAVTLNITCDGVLMYWEAKTIQIVYRG